MGGWAKQRTSCISVSNKRSSGLQVYKIIFDLLCSLKTIFSLYTLLLDMIWHLHFLKWPVRNLPRLRILMSLQISCNSRHTIILSNRAATRLRLAFFPSATAMDSYWHMWLPGVEIHYVFHAQFDMQAALASVAKYKIERLYLVHHQQLTHVFLPAY